MTMERGVRLLAGSMVLISLGLAHWISPYWFLLTGFVGLNLFQSALTGWCPAELMLKRLGLKNGTAAGSCSR